MTIQRKAAYICYGCFVYASQVCYKQWLMGKVGKDALMDKSVEGDDTVPVKAIKETEQHTLQSENLILAAVDHVKKQQSQQDLFISLKKPAKKWGNVESQKLQVHTFVVDLA
jgi:hypothetical protein